MLITDVNYNVNIFKIKENEYKWYNYGDDKAEFLMELSDLIFENLVEDFVLESMIAQK